MNKPPVPPRRALGKGLTSLLPSRTETPQPAAVSSPEAGMAQIDINLIEANPLQPRRTFHADRLNELAQSIRANGIIQPLVLRRWGDRYQLVAGERRWRAAKMAGMERVPSIVQDIPDERLLEVTLIENIQREDLNPIEVATTYSRMSSELHMGVEAMAQRTGKDRTTILNLLRLLQLPPDIQQLVAERRLSAGHARCLLALSDAELQRKVAEKSVAQGLSVREVERWTQRLTQERNPQDAVEEPIDPNVKAAIQEMQRALGTKVRILPKARRGGKIEIDYYSDDDLDRIYSTIVGDTTS